ncbi:MAG: four helix bundle protein [Bacteroidetes bacterium]|nr:MAG: four helix bundle protein [Bacteroidota bacterium]
MKSYLDLDVWKQSRLLVKSIYQATALFPNDEKFGLVNQMRRSAVSVPSNIAEGSGRSTAQDSLRFFFIARGSLFELETQLYLSFDLDFLPQKSLDSLIEQVTSCKKLLHGFINYYQTLV